MRSRKHTPPSGLFSDPPHLHPPTILTSPVLCSDPSAFSKLPWQLCHLLNIIDKNNYKESLDTKGSGLESGSILIGFAKTDTARVKN